MTNNFNNSKNNNYYNINNKNLYFNIGKMCESSFEPLNTPTCAIILI